MLSGVLALNPTDGRTLWTSSTTVNVHWQSPVVVNGRVYTGDDSGNFYAWALPNDRTRAPQTATN